MKTSTANRNELARIGSSYPLRQAQGESLVIHGQIPSWREDALARAGDYAVAGQLAESRKFAKLFEEGR